MSQMFGMSEDDFRRGVERSAEMMSHGMIAMSILSDSQELITLGQLEDARQAINQAKWVISTYLKEKRS